jgi:phosphosulfolactate phosphohydrolase-like enzyme
VLTTTNGAPAIVAATGVAPEVRLACLLNLDASIRALATHAGGDVLIVCSGTDGAVALEDVYVAGRLSAALLGERSDAARVAEAVAAAFPTPLDALAASSDAGKLRALDLDSDIADCAVESTLDVIPIVTDVAGGVATVSIAVADELDPAVDRGDTVRV